MLFHTVKFPNPSVLSQLSIALTCSLFMALGIGCGASSVQDSPVTETNTPSTRAKTLVWGKVDLQPTDAINEWQPTVDYLAANLGNVGIEMGRIKIAPDSETLGRWMAAGEVDVVRDSYYPAMIISDISGAVPIAFRMTGKDPKHAVFFTRADSGITSLSEFEGKVIAFAEPDSTSGFMLPRAYLSEQGFEASEIPAADSPVAPDQIGYVFAGDDDVVATWVLSGRVVAGVVDDGTFEEFVEQNPGKLAIVAETRSISTNNPVLVRKDMDPVVAQALKKVLIEMADTPDGQDVLKTTKTVSFEEILEIQSVEWERARDQYLMIKD